MSPSDRFDVWVVLDQEGKVECRSLVREGAAAYAEEGRRVFGWKLTIRRMRAVTIAGPNACAKVPGRAAAGSGRKRRG